jgi:hypothetical protein
MAKPHPFNNPEYYKILCFIENNSKVKPKLIRDYLNKEKKVGDFKEANVSKKLDILVKAKLIGRKGFNKSSRLEINYSGIIEFIFKEFFNYDAEDLKELNFNDKLLIFLIKDYLKNSCFTLEEIQVMKKQIKNSKDLEEFTLKNKDDKEVIEEFKINLIENEEGLSIYGNEFLDISNQTIYSILEMFIFGFGRAQDLAFRRETYYDGTYKNLKLENTETFNIFRESALNYYHKKSDNPYTEYISEKIYNINRVIIDDYEDKKSLSSEEIEEEINKAFKKD